MTAPSYNTHHAVHLIATKQVLGATVYSADLEELGIVADVLIDGTAGRLVYAVLKFGGYFGIARHYYPLLWEKVTYNPELQVYVADVTHDDVIMGATRVNPARSEKSPPGDDDAEFFGVPG